MRFVVILCLLVSPNLPAADLPPIEIKAVSYADLGRAIRAHEGKVVVVDIWASWCGPCRAEFPHLIALHKKYAAQGLVCISLSVDKPEGAAAALNFLKKQGATFANYRLQESDSWSGKFGLKSIPAVYVFNRTGKRAAKLTQDSTVFSYEKDVEPLVKKLLIDK